MLPCTVRPAIPADLPAVLELLALMHGASHPEPPSQTEIDIFQRILAQERRTLLVAVLSEEIVGTADLLVVENLSHDSQPWAIVENVVVLPTMRRRGIARALMRHIDQLALSLGCYKVQLISNERRSEAHALYESEGYNAPVRGFRKYY